MSDKKIYEETAKAYGYACALCGNPQYAMHHIRYGEHLRKTHKGNVIPLCEYHHRLVHTDKETYMPILIRLSERVMK